MKKPLPYTNLHYFFKLLQLKKPFSLMVLTLIFCANLTYAQDTEHSISLIHSTEYKLDTLAFPKKTEISLNEEAGNSTPHAFYSLDLKGVQLKHKKYNYSDHKSLADNYWLNKNKSDLPIASFHSSDHTLKDMASYLIDIRKLTQKGFTILKMDAFSKKVSV